MKKRQNRNLYEQRRLAGNVGQISHFRPKSMLGFGRVTELPVHQHAETLE